MPTILPNWHPITIHFAIGLLIASTALMLIASVGRRQAWGRAAAVVAHWNLALGIVAASAALATGWYAYNTVTHDDPSHANMVVHLRWALAATAAYALVALLALLGRRRPTGPSPVAAVASIAAAAVLVVTAFYGGENVYRYGLGVMALPDQDHHHHDMAMPSDMSRADHKHAE